VVIGPAPRIRGTRLHVFAAPTQVRGRDASARIGKFLLTQKAQRVRRSGGWGLGSWSPRVRDALTRGLVNGVWFPRLRDASPHSRDTLTRAYARISDSRKIGSGLSTDGCTTVSRWVVNL